jgi:uncharacterized protein (TIGR03032 family)
MNLAVTFCNQRRTPGFGLAVLDRIWTWIPLHTRTGKSDFTGATGITEMDNRLLVSLQSRSAQLVSFDRQWNPTTSHIAGPADVHDIASDANRLVVASSGNDSIWQLGASPHPIWMKSASGIDEHHVNGIACDGDMTVVTFFGTKGNRSWADVSNGEVVDLDRETLIQGIHHPHSPRLSDGELWYCESGRGMVHVIDARSLGSHRSVDVGGYSRGLLVTEDTVITGISSSRSESRSEGTTNLVSAEASWTGLVFINRHTLAVEERMDLSDLGAEIFDIAEVSGFDPHPGPDAAEVRGDVLANAD